MPLVHSFTSAVFKPYNKICILLTDGDENTVGNGLSNIDRFVGIYRGNILINFVCIFSTRKKDLCSCINIKLEDDTPSWGESE